MQNMDLTLFRNAIKSLIVQTVGAMKLSRVVYAQLISIAPITFRRGTDIVMKSEDVTLPYDIQFKNEDIGSVHAFIQETGWQSYLYLHRTR